MKTAQAIIADIDCLISEPDVTDAGTETIVCLHGIGGDDASFEPQLPLADQYRVIAWNMPGYKKSATVSPLTFEVIAEKLHRFIIALDAGSVHLMGQSIGGMIAQETYHRYPDSIKSLTLVATTAAFGGRDESFKNAFLKARLKPLDSGMNMQQMADAAMPAIVGKNTEQHIIEAAINSMSSLNEDVYRDVLRCLVTFNRRAEWSKIKCPVCLVSGSEDTNAPAVTMQKMGNGLSHAHYHEIAGAGHLVNLEKGAEFNIIVRSFLSS